MPDQSFETRVRLLHGDGRGYWSVERVFVLGPHHTLGDLAIAIESEFDRDEQETHWHMFELKRPRTPSVSILGAWDEEGQRLIREGWDFLDYLRKDLLERNPQLTEYVRQEDERSPKRIRHLTDEFKVLDFVDPGVHFEYVFDMGASWTHDCFIPKRGVDKHPTPLEPLCISRIGDPPEQYEEEEQ